MDIIKEDIIRVLGSRKALTIDELFSCDYLAYADRSSIYFALESLTTQGLIQKRYIKPDIPVYCV